jgi:protein TonB
MNRAAFLLSLAGHVGVGLAVTLIGGSTGSPTARGGGGDAELVWVSLVEAPAGRDSAEQTAPTAPTPTTGSGSRPSAPVMPRPAPAAVAAAVESRADPVVARALASSETSPGRVDDARPSEPTPVAVAAAPAARSDAPRAAAAVAERGAGATPGGGGGGAFGALPDWPGPGGVDRAARPRWPIRPRYPARARRDGEESQVVVEAWIDEGGAVAFSSVLQSGGEAFDVSAVRAVEHSAFRPARLRGRDVASRLALRIHFQLYD